MNSTRKIWAAATLLAGVWLIWRATTLPIGTVWVRDIPPAAGANGPVNGLVKTVVVEPKLRPLKNVPNPGANPVRLSIPRTVGLWIAALSTLAVLSFLWGDNPGYRLVEAVIVGASAGYNFTIGFWEVLVPKLAEKLVPGLVRASINPEIAKDASTDWWLLVPLALSVLMLCRLIPKAAWISRWPMAFFIGATAGMKLLTTFESDFVRQVQSTILPLIVLNNAGGFSWQGSLKNLTILVGVLSALTYFYFSAEHKGLTGKVSRVGIWFLMITFGAGFANTVMTRITFMSARLEFLFIDWLWLIDPTGKLGLKAGP